MFRNPVPISTRLRARLRQLLGRESGLGFSLRLGLSLAIALAVVGVAGYALIAGQLQSRQIANYSSALRGDVHRIEVVRARSRTPALGMATIGRVLGAIGTSPGVVQALLIDPRGIVVAGGSPHSAVDSRDLDPRIDATLRRGVVYEGPADDRPGNAKSFEFLAPVRLWNGRYALEIGYDHRFLDSNLASVRSVLMLTGLLALIVGALVFYLVGGRSLMRSHRIALQRGMRDGLTDLPNHRAFQEDLLRAVASANRHDQHLGLAVLDIDDFKILNDRHAMRTATPCSSASPRSWARAGSRIAPTGWEVTSSRSFCRAWTRRAPDGSRDGSAAR